MEQTQELQVAQTQEAPKLVTIQVTEQQAQWAGLAEAKNSVIDKLTNGELVAQSLLMTAEKAGENHEVIDTQLAAYRKHFDEMVKDRRAFTSIIDDNITKPLMAFEKRVDPKSNEKYNNLFNKSVDIRRKKNLEAQQANARNQEEASFKAHCKNQFTRMVGEFQAVVRREANNIYKSYLQSHVQDPAIADLKMKLREIPAPPFEGFAPQYLTREKMQEIYASLKPEYPNWQAIFDDLMKEVDALFANYSSDLANAEAAIKAQEDALALAEQAAKKKQEEDQAMTTLVTQAETAQVEGPRIKKELKVVTRTDWNWAFAVMANFMPNFENLSSYVRVKEPGNLKVQQMADALGRLATETGMQFNGLELEELCK